MLPRFTRRVFLAAMPTLVAGCGGGASDTRPEDALPEGYREAYSVDVSGDGRDYFTRALIAAPDEGVLLWQTALTDNAETVTLRLVRYTNGAMPGASERSEPMASRLVNDALAYQFTTGVSATGKIYASQIGGDAIPLGSPGGDILRTFDVLSAAGVPEGVVTLEATNPSYNLSGMSRSVSVAPNGDFYRAPASFFSGGNTIHPAYILQWKAEGSFTRVHNGATNGSLTGFDVFFALDGTALTLARDHERGVFGIVSVDNTAGRPLLPLAVAHESASRRVQTDAAGNLYVSTAQAPAGRATTRTDPPPIAQYIRKFSPAGIELAAVRFASYAADEPFAVGADGTVFAASGTGLRVFKQTR